MNVTNPKRAMKYQLFTLILISTLTLFLLLLIFARRPGDDANHNRVSPVNSRPNSFQSQSSTRHSPTDTASIYIQTSGPVTPINPFIFGSNLPAWLNPVRFENSTFRARTMATGLTMLRMPGGSWSNTYDWLACENGMIPDCEWPWAARPTDFLNFLRATGIEGMWVVSPNGTAQEAAALVAFFNAAITDTTPIGVDLRGRDWLTAGHWAQLRRDHGNPEPLPVKLWEVGNEVYGGEPDNHPECQPHGWEEVWTCDGTEYVNGVGSGSERHQGYLEFRQAMRAVDSTIQVGVVGTPFATQWHNWGNEVIAAAGEVMDFYSIHQYAYFNPSASYADVLAQPHRTWPDIRADLNTALETHAGDRDIPTAVTEYGLFSAGDLDDDQMMIRAVNTLFIADTLGQIIQSGFAMALQWDLANGRFLNGTDYGLLDPETFARNPPYYVFPLWTRFGHELLSLTSTASAAATLSLYAGWIDPQTFSILAINKTAHPITTTIHLPFFTITGGVVDLIQATTLTATTVTFNGLSDPADDLSDAPSIPLEKVSTPLVYTFAPYAITLLRLDAEMIPVHPTYLPLILK
jgi:hypothetical protein